MNIGGLFLVQPAQDFTQAGGTISQGIQLGASNGQLSISDQEVILSSASNTPGGAALNRKQLIAAGSIALVVGIGAGYLLAHRKRK